MSRAMQDALNWYWRQDQERRWPVAPGYRRDTVEKREKTEEAEHVGAA